MEEPKELLIGFIKDENGNMVLNTHKDYVIKEVNGKFMLLKKNPLNQVKDYSACKKFINPSMDSIPMNISHKGHLMMKFQKLLICRDAYWKIAGDWVPDWKDFSTQKHSISVDKYKIITSCRTTGSRVLVFPTEEMRDAFYENFKELIEQCKELL